MAVMYYPDLCQKIINRESHKWLKETFDSKPNAVAVVVCPYPVEGAAQWFVEDDETAKQVAKKLGTKSRVWTLATAQDYLGCFGEKAATVREAALLFDRDEYNRKDES